MEIQKLKASIKDAFIILQTRFSHRLIGGVGACVDKEMGLLL